MSFIKQKNEFYVKMAHVVFCYSKTEITLLYEMLTEFICDLGSTVGAWTSVRQFSLCECCGHCSLYIRCTLYMDLHEVASAADVE